MPNTKHNHHINLNTIFFAQNVCRVIEEMVGIPFAFSRDSVKIKPFSPSFKMVVYAHFSGTVQGNYALSLDEFVAAKLFGINTEGISYKDIQNHREDVGAFIKELLNISLNQSIIEIEKEYGFLTVSPGIVIYGKAEFPEVQSGIICLRNEETEIECVFSIDLVQQKVTKKLEQLNKDLVEINKDLTIFKKFAEASNQGLGMTDLNGNITYANPALYHILGERIPKKIIGKNIYSFYPEGFQQKLKNEINSAIIDKGQWVGEIQLCLLNGNQIPAIQSFFTILDNSGKIIYIATVITDITKRKQAEEEIRKLNEQLEQRVIERTSQLNMANLELKEAVAHVSRLANDANAANIAKSQFLANMSHEIRNPLNGIMGFIDMLLDTTLDEHQSDYATIIQKSGNSLLFLINDILDFSKIESGDLEFEEIDFDLELTAYDVCELIRPKIESKSIELLCHIGDKLPSYAKGDPFRFRQVLINLMGNAIKFTEFGEIELFLGIEDEKKEKIKLHATIRDTGIGIPPDKLKMIFKSFQQADGSTTRQYGGTGLGLSICKQISNLMGGDVWVESEVNKGSIFHFTAWVKKAKKEKIERFKPVTISGKKVLIIDDNQTNLDILKLTLDTIGMRVVELNSGKKVIETLKDALDTNEPFDLCICDINMPELSGYDVAKQIRSSKHLFSSLPLIALSAAVKGSAKISKDSGFSGFLTKPIIRQKLFNMMENILGKMKSAQERNKSVHDTIITQYTLREELKHSVRILLVDDNLVNQKLIKLMLTKAGYQVTDANNGLEAIDKYTTSPDDFDLIFMDIQMPKMDGKEATKKIREKGFNTIPIIAMTAHTMKGDKEKCLKSGMNDFISKPIKREIVFEIIEKWIFKDTKK